MVTRAGRAGGRPDLDSVVVWVGGACMAAGAAGGCCVGWLSGRDQATEASDVPWFAAVGLVVGIVLGLAVSIGAIFVLVAVGGRSWASPRPLRALLAAAGAAVPLTLVVAILYLDRRTARRDLLST